MAAGRKARATEERRGDGRGFTLVELMITIIVLLVLLVASAASLGIFSPKASRTELHDATNQLLENLEFARLRAEMTGTAVSVQIVEDGNSAQWVQIWDFPANTCLDPPVGDPVRNVCFTSTVGAKERRGTTGTSTPPPLYDEVTIVGAWPTSILDSGEGLCFTPSGRMMLTDGTIVAADPATQLAAGEAALSLRMRVEQDLPDAIQHDVVVPFNGIAKVRYHVP